MKRGSITTIVFLLVFLLLSGPVFAAVPWLISYQGKVTDSEQVPLEGFYTMIFRLYAFEGATSPIWAEQQTVSATDGVFQVQLGAGTNLVGGVLDSTLIAGQDRWLEIEIEGEVLNPRQQLTSTAYALLAETADSALRITGALPSMITADDEGYALSVSNSGTGGAADLDGFVNVDHGDLLVQGDGSFDAGGEEGTLYLGDTENYIKAIRDFGVSIGTFVADDALVVQAGTGNVGIGTTDPQARLDVAGPVHSSGALEVGSAVKNLAIFTDGAVVDIKSTGAALGINYPGDTDTVINVNGGRVGIGVDPPSEKLSVNGTVESKNGGFKFPDGSSQASAGASQAYVSALEARIAVLESLLAGVTRSGSDITFSGVNVHVVNGTGTTDGTPNGVGNLIVGYNEVRGSGDDRSGSHNLVVGSKNNYSSYGGLVAGYYNTISGQYASVSGGSGNTANGDYASVTGGASNTASGHNASISGGSYNKASGRAAFVGGGGSGNSVDGNEAFGDYSAILGGHTNLSGDPGRIDHSIGQNATISGGGFNQASGNSAFVGGGGGIDVYKGNIAFANYSAILGGVTNGTGDIFAFFNYDLINWELIPGSNHSIGTASTVTGGNANIANTYASNVSGGQNNTASGMYSSVSGGKANTATDNLASVTGGENNTASGWHSSVSGGYGNTASGDYASVTGGSFNTANNFHASVSGGDTNTASGWHSSVSGGNHNTASGDHSSVSGGRYNKASGEYSFVGGGGYSFSDYGNEAFSNYSAVLGGSNNIAGDNTDPTHSTGERSTISGGDKNRAKGGRSSISGGLNNSALGEYSFIGGGGHSNAAFGNLAYANLSVILGGSNNTTGVDGDPTTGELSTVAGGDTNTASGWAASVGGGQGVTADTDKSWKACEEYSCTSP